MQMKKRYVALAVLLIIIAIFAVSQVVKQKEISLELEQFITGAKGVSESIDWIIRATYDEEITAALLDTTGYFDYLINYADGLDHLPEEQANKFKISKGEFKKTNDKIWSIYEKHISEVQLTVEDQELLKSVKDYVDSLLNYVEQRYRRIP